MINIAYSLEYQAYRKKWEAVFMPANLTNVELMMPNAAYSSLYNLQMEKWARGMEDYRIERSYYETESDGKKLWGAETVIFNNSGALIYKYRTDDDGGDFISFIKHSNGNNYFMFRTSLYGYGIFDITLKKDYFYIPDEPETFIWTDVHYNAMSNMLAVEGCVWACPYSVNLIDFADPMNESKWVDVLYKLDGGYKKYEGLEFSRWDGNNLILKTSKYVNENNEISSDLIEIKISETKYIRWF
jgi:hypothetical protein